MARVCAVVVLTLVIVAVDGSAVAVQQQPPQGRGAEAQQGGSQHMHGMMAQCQEHHQMMGAALAKALTTVREARASSDPAKLRAALEQVEASLTGMQQRMSGCAAMMTRMSEMMTTMMGMMGGGQGTGMMRGGPRGGSATPAPER